MDKLGNNTKTAKAPKGWENRILHLSPMNKAFKIWKAHKKEVEHLALKRLGRDYLTPEDIDRIKAFNSCPWAGFCGKICLDTAGRGKFSTVQIARAAKTIHKILDSDLFDLELVKEIEREEKKAKKQGKKLAIRLNGTSDLDWVGMVIQHFPNIQFYDYTKSQQKILDMISGREHPKNYYLTYSYDRNNDKDPRFMLVALSHGIKVAIMKKDLENLERTIPDDIYNFPTIDGDSHDLRFIDKKVKGGAFVVLKEKGDAKK